MSPSNKNQHSGASGLPIGRHGLHPPVHLSHEDDHKNNTKPTPSLNLHPILLLLKGYLDLLHPHALDQAVTSARKHHLAPFFDSLRITSGPTFLAFANDLLHWVPHENHEGKDIYNIICAFYLVLDQPPLHDLQTPIDPSSVGIPLTWLSAWTVTYAQLIGQWLDTPASLTPASLQSFKDSPLYTYGECEEPAPHGFRSFNEFFARKLKPGARPIADPEDHHIIVYPTDCTFDDSTSAGSIVPISDTELVTVKNVSWRIQDLLQGSKYQDEFTDGIWMHAFLNTYNYHRQHAPVSGKVVEAINIQGACYLQVDAGSDDHAKGGKGYFVPRPHRTIAGPDAPDAPGYQFLQTRGLVVIDSPLGLVAVLPIGMAQVSSVKLTVDEGEYVGKGEEISYFQFGGSDIVCVFQKKAGLTVESFVKSPDKTHSNMGTVLARAPRRS